MGLLGLAQDVELHYEGAPIGSSLSLNLPSSGSGAYFHDTLYLVNMTGADIAVTYQRIRRYHKYGWTDQLCDDNICYTPADDNTPASENDWTKPANPVLTIMPGDSSVFWPKIYPNNVDGCSIYTYIIKTGAFNSYADSVQVAYTIGGISCFLGEDEIELPVKYSVYPNPVNDVLNIEIEGMENNTSIVIFDIVGKKVEAMNLVNGKNQLSVENLNAGVYFYSVMKNSVIIETKKLIVK